ncbi:MAG TPA: hypothetical protein DEP27_03750 [Ruminococcaceae bacterium]|nr:hypothetical protein [Oscillospiraceae bacterium]
MLVSGTDGTGPENAEKVFWKSLTHSLLCFSMNLYFKRSVPDMFGKSDNASENEVNEIIQRFNLQGLSDDEKNALFSMAKDRTLVTMSATAVTDFAFKKTLVYQKWMILSRLLNLEKK